MVGQSDVVDEFVNAGVLVGGNGAFVALYNAVRHSGDSFGEAHSLRSCAQAFQSLSKQSGGGCTQNHAVQVFGLGNDLVGANGTEAEAVVGVQNLDVVFFCQTILDFSNDVGVHYVVVFFVGSIQHGTDQNCAVTNVVSEQGGFFQTHPVSAHVSLSNGVTVAVQLILSVVSNGDMAIGTLSDHLSQHFGSLAVHFFGLENVGELDFDIEIICFIGSGFGSGSCLFLCCGGGLSSLAATGDQRQDHDQSQNQCEDLLHNISLLLFVCFSQGNAHQEKTNCCRCILRTDNPTFCTNGKISFTMSII